MPVENQTEGPRGVLAVMVAVMAVLALAAVMAVYLIRGTDVALGPHTTDGPGRAPAAPVDLAPQTAWVEARILPSGDVRVRHWIRSDRDLFEISLSVPPGVHTVAGSPPVRVRAVRVVAGSREISGRKGLRDGRGFYAFAGSTEVFVSYLLEGAVERSGSVAGRVLARIVAADVALTRPLLATTYAVSGGNVLNLACSSPHAGSVPFPCGSPAGAGWTVRLAREDRSDVVSAQLDLP